MVASLVVVLYSTISVALVSGIPRAPIDEVTGFGDHVVERADSSLTGYLGAFFLGADPYVYLYLSSGNDPISFKALNKGSPVIKPTKGTGGVRDPAIVRGGGTEAGNKWYIVGTDLNIGKVCSPLTHRLIRLTELDLTHRDHRPPGMPRSGPAREGYLFGRAKTL